MKDETNLTEEESRLADLLFDIEDNSDFVNDAMTIADDLEIIQETADYIENHMGCTKSDVLLFMASFMEMVLED